MSQSQSNSYLDIIKQHPYAVTGSFVTGSAVGYFGSKYILDMIPSSNNLSKTLLYGIPIGVALVVGTSGSIFVINQEREDSNFIKEFTDHPLIGLISFSIGSLGSIGLMVYIAAPRFLAGFVSIVAGIFTSYLGIKIWSSFADIFESVKHFFSKIGEAIDNFWGSITGKAKKIGSDVLHGIEHAGETVVHEGQSILQDIKHAGKTAIHEGQSILQDIEHAGETAIKEGEKIVEDIEKETDTFINIIESPFVNKNEPLKYNGPLVEVNGKTYPKGSTEYETDLIIHDQQVLEQLNKMNQQEDYEKQQAIQREIDFLLIERVGLERYILTHGPSPQTSSAQYRISQINKRLQELGYRDPQYTVLS
jgi:hypothetical protein